MKLLQIYVHSEVATNVFNVWQKSDDKTEKDNLVSDVWSRANQLY